VSREACGANLGDGGNKGKEHSVVGAASGSSGGCGCREKRRVEPIWATVDQRISGSAVDGAPTEEPRPDANNARRQRPAPEGNWRVPCSCLLCWNPRGCPQVHSKSIPSESQ
jgi:hypothetical protein